VVGHPDGVPGELEERRQDLRQRRRRYEHRLGDPGQHGDVRRHGLPRVDQGGELGQLLPAADLDRADLGDPAAVRCPAGGLQVDDHEGGVPQRPGQRVVEQVVEGLLDVGGEHRQTVWLGYDSSLCDTGQMAAQVSDADRPDGAAGEPAYAPEPTLPEPVRQRVVALASAALSGLPLDEVPLPLRRLAKFAPNRRARLAGSAIAAQLAGDPLFRQRVSGRVLEEAADLGTAVLEGACPAAADPVEVAALAYLARPP